jgi:hypothetical protein
VVLRIDIGGVAPAAAAKLADDDGFATFYVPG